MNNIKIIYKKELLDTIRDKRTIISMIIVPILLFPLLTLGFSSFAASMVKKSTEETHKVTVIGKNFAPELYAIIDSSSKVEIVEVDSIEQAINDKIIRAALVIPEDFAENTEAMDSASLTIVYNGTESKSDFAAAKLRDFAREYRTNIVDKRLAEYKIDPQIIKPFLIMNNNIGEEKMGAFMLSMFLPYVIIMLSMIGAMYTAIDLTAGEKERGTLETILVSPIPRWQLATGKFLTILTTSLVSTILAISSMSATMSFGIMSAGPMAENVGFDITFQMIFVILLMMLPAACLFSALLMSIAIFAKSFKEAQSYTSPLMIIVILPSLVSFIPGIELNLQLAFVPIVNICLVIKESLIGTIEWLHVFIVFFSTSIYAAFAIFITHRMFEKESVIFRS
ncbi:MAG: ABC transporter permease [candidate division Zixibacteria bacterium]|nr:ABC transporter permease [candidate division Zixibacteria bacterium]